jgi:hypothetical protein
VAVVTTTRLARCAPQTARHAAGRSPGRALAGESGPYGERAGQFLLRCQPGMLDQRAGGREPARVTCLGQDRGGANRGQACDRGDQSGEASSFRTPIMRCSVSASRRCAWFLSSRSATLSSAPGGGRPPTRATFIARPPRLARSASACFSSLMYSDWPRARTFQAGLAVSDGRQRRKSFPELRAFVSKRLKRLGCQGI